MVLKFVLVALLSKSKVSVVVNGFGWAAGLHHNPSAMEMDRASHTEERPEFSHKKSESVQAGRKHKKATPYENMAANIGYGGCNYGAIVSRGTLKEEISLRQEPQSCVTDRSENLADPGVKGVLFVHICRRYLTQESALEYFFTKFWKSTNDLVGGFISSASPRMPDGARRHLVTAETCTDKPSDTQNPGSTVYLLDFGLTLCREVDTDSAVAIWLDSLIPVNEAVAHGL
ncbi:hypothetical protein RRG08_004303 [Elysia crispata]|uniref:Uncharacterized protein n=1 Tax=Elysia crispata TaxID=231223 RepID=A0AAE1CVZ0_9GAST|nr:hypothetical protein RRG08_004303 [Elysia crispata]